MIRRLLTEPGALASDKVELGVDAAHYVRRVLRLKVGDTIALCDGAGRFGQGQVKRLTKADVLIELSVVEAAPAEAPPAITLIQAVSKGEKMDAVVRQATELGVAAIIPVLTERAVAEKRSRVDRWRAIAEDAVRVSHRSYRPEIEPVVELAEVLARPRERPDVRALVLALTGGPLSSVATEKTPAHVLVGPEGGLTEGEVAAAVAAGFTAVSLGTHVLRTDTAGPAVVAILRYGGGAFG